MIHNDGNAVFCCFWCSVYCTSRSGGAATAATARCPFRDHGWLPLLRRSAVTHRQVRSSSIWMVWGPLLRRPPAHRPPGRRLLVGPLLPAAAPEIVLDSAPDRPLVQRLAPEPDPRPQPKPDPAAASPVASASVPAASPPSAGARAESVRPMLHGARHKLRVTSYKLRGAN